MPEAVIVSAVRTPVGRARKGSFKDIRPDDLAAVAVREAVNRVPGLNPEEIEDLIMGCANLSGEQSGNIARVIGFLAQLPDKLGGVSVNRYCSSGLQAINMAAQAIQTGMGDIFIAGGVECMSRVPMGSGGVPNPKLIDSADFPDVYIPMGQTAENVARRYGITRQEQDEFALRSHQRAVAATQAGRFKEEIVPVTTPEGTVVTIDDGPRPDTTLEILGQLAPAFREDGTVTAGNSSPLNDGAAATILMSDSKAQELGLTPMARWVGTAVAGVPPEIMGIGPVPAVRKLLGRLGLSISDMDLIELNEAFAAQALAVVRDLEIDQEKLNVNGGAIALGHPLGCTGARIAATLLHELKRRDAHFGLETMCIGGGQGLATVFERLS